MGWKVSFCLNSVGWGLVTWLHLAAKSFGKCSQCLGSYFPSIILPCERSDTELADSAMFYAIIWFTLNYSEQMAPHSSTLAWKIPWTEEPGRLQSMGSRRVGHDWATSLSFFTFMHWRRKWQPTPVFLPGESQGWGSLVGCRLWGHTESDTTEAT